MSDKDKAPERVWAVVGEIGGVWATFDEKAKAERYPGPRMMECAARQVIEYVRADLLATVRKEVWREVLTIADAHLNEPGFGYLLRQKLIDAAALERAAESGEGENDGISTRT